MTQSCDHMTWSCDHMTQSCDHMTQSCDHMTQSYDQRNQKCVVLCENLKIYLVEVDSKAFQKSLHSFPPPVCLSSPVHQVSCVVAPVITTE